MLEFLCKNRTTGGRRRNLPIALVFLSLSPSIIWGLPCGLVRFLQNALATLADVPATRRMRGIVPRTDEVASSNGLTMAQKGSAMALAPHWLDSVIEGVIRENNPDAVARAIAHSDRFLGAIRDGIERARNAPPGMMGPTHAQYIRQAVQEAVESAS